MHQSLELVSAASIATPRNDFPLAPGKHDSIFIAGGMGMTPIQAMTASLHADASGWELHYCARSPAHSTSYDELVALGPDRVHPYFSEEPIFGVPPPARGCSRPPV